MSKIYFEKRVHPTAHIMRTYVNCSNCSMCEHIDSQQKLFSFRLYSFASLITNSSIVVGHWLIVIQPNMQINYFQLYDNISIT